MILTLSPTTYVELYPGYAVIWDQLAIINGIPQVRKVKITGNQFKNLEKELNNELKLQIHPRTAI